MNLSKTLLIATLIVFACNGAQSAFAQVRIGDICHVQGQSQKKLIGLGLLFGLDGTGDPDKFAPTVQATAMALRMLGTDVGSVEALKGQRNAALVYIEAIIPPAGLSKGQLVDCRVTAAGAAKKSLAGGQLLPTPLIPQVPSGDMENPGVYAYASGPISIDEDNVMAGTIANGCQMEADLITPIQTNGFITIEVDPKHSEWGISDAVAEAINAEFGFSGASRDIAFAPHMRTIVVEIPQYERNRVAGFIGRIMQTPISVIPKAARVIVDERSGTIVIDPEVEIEASAFSVPGINVQVTPGDSFATFDPQASINPNQFRTAKLQALVDALNAIRVPPEKVIAIVKTLDAAGRIHGHVEYLR